MASLHMLFFLLTFSSFADSGVDCNPPPAAFHFSFATTIADEEHKHGFEHSLEFTRTHLHFFLHHVVAGPNRTASRVTAATISSTNSAGASGFGTFIVFDDPLTAGPDPGSVLVGRAQGLYALASATSATSVFVLAFENVREFNGSSLAVLGEFDSFSDTAAEMPIVGGSGRFRLAGGHVSATTYKLDLFTGNAIVEYKVLVICPALPP